ncbi:MAG: hypothetical protein ACOX8T_08460 [Bacillota bacterium]|jgi:hypothetical protein
MAYPFLLKANRLHVESSVFFRLLRFLENIIFRGRLRGGKADLEMRLKDVLVSFDKANLNEKITQAIGWLKDDNSWWSYWGNQEMKRLLGDHFYECAVDNYFYWQYELSCWGSGYGGPVDLNFDSLVSDENIEHIAPQTPTDGNPVAHGYGVYKDAINTENGIPPDRRRDRQSRSGEQAL